MKRKFNIKNIFKGDLSIWIIYLFLSGISLWSVYSSIGLYAITDVHTTPLSLFTRHAAFVLISYVAIIGITPLKTDFLYKAAPIVFLVSMGIVVAAMLMHTRWITVFGITFQPSETVKLGLMLLIARFMQKRRDELDDPKVFATLFIIIGVVSLMVFPENFSTAALIFVSCMFAIYFGGIESKMWMRVMCVMLVLGVLVLTAFYLWGSEMELFRSSTWSNRIDAWLHPNDNLSQGNMAKMAIASGGATGQGIGETIHARLMTQAHNDFIFAIIIEEHGTVGGTIVFLLYTIFFRRCIKIVRKCHDYFSATLVAGISTVIYFQALVNMSVAVGLLPVTGQTLPFISFGGTAYLILSAGIGIIQCISFNNKKYELQHESEKTDK